MNSLLIEMNLTNTKWILISEDREDILDIFHLAMNGDRVATNKVIERYIKMVHMWINKYKGMFPDYAYDDLVQEGTMGIMDALSTYDKTKRTASGKPINPSTWVWWKTRASVQSAARRYKRDFNNVSLNLSDNFDISQEGNEELKEISNSILLEKLKKVIKEVCGSENSKKALIIRDKFGLGDCLPMSCVELARKHGVSKQATSVHISSFCKEVRAKYPELKGAI